MTHGGQRVRVALAIVPDDEGATATLTAVDAFEETLGHAAVPPSFVLNARSALAWVESGYARPA